MLQITRKFKIELIFIIKTAVHVCACLNAEHGFPTKYGAVSFYLISDK